MGMNVGSWLTLNDRLYRHCDGMNAAMGRLVQAKVTETKMKEIAVLLSCAGLRGRGVASF
jgi:hypothetical protein